MAEKGKDREAFLAEAGRRYDEMISRSGSESGDTFDDIEQQAESAGKAMILKLLADRLSAEERSQADKVICSGCGNAMRRPKDRSHRNLETFSGDVDYERRHAICDECGESFSPSGPAAEDSASRQFEPLPEEGV